MSFEPGDLVVVAKDREGIVVEPAETPPLEWLEIQNNPLMRTHKDSAWWTIYLLAGGSVWMPEPLIRFLRHAAPDDFREAVRNAHDFAARILEGLIPESVDKTEPGGKAKPDSGRNRRDLGGPVDE